MSDTPVINFTAEVVKVQTMASDYAIRVTLDLPESMTGIAMQLMECKRRGAVLEIAAVPVIQEGNSNAKIPTRSEWKP